MCLLPQAPIHPACCCRALVAIGMVVKAVGADAIMEPGKLASYLQHVQQVLSSAEAEGNYDTIEECMLFLVAIVDDPDAPPILSKRIMELAVRHIQPAGVGHRLIQPATMLL